MPRTEPDATPAKAYARRRAIIRDLMADLKVAYRMHAKAHRARPRDWRYPNDLDEVCLRLIQLVDVLVPNPTPTPRARAAKRPQPEAVTPAPGPTGVPLDLRPSGEE